MNFVSFQMSCFGLVFFHFVDQPLCLSLLKPLTKLCAFFCRLSPSIVLIFSTRISSSIVFVGFHFVSKLVKTILLFCHGLSLYIPSHWRMKLWLLGLASLLVIWSILKQHVEKQFLLCIFPIQHLHLVNYLLFCVMSPYGYYQR